MKDKELLEMAAKDTGKAIHTEARVWRLIDTVIITREAIE